MRSPPKVRRIRNPRHARSRRSTCASLELDPILGMEPAGLPRPHLGDAGRCASGPRRRRPQRERRSTRRVGPEPVPFLVHEEVVLEAAGLHFGELIARSDRERDLRPEHGRADERDAALRVRGGAATVRRRRGVQTTARSRRIYPAARPNPAAAICAVSVVAAIVTSCMDILQRFMTKVSRDPLTGCWNWTAYVQPNGYGVFGVGSRTDNSRRRVLTHRWSYEHFVGPIPAGLTIDHLCRNRRCVNPEHLQVVTYRTNLLRGDTITARHAAATTCPQGHPYSEINTYVHPEGERVCRTCHRERGRQAHDALRTDPARHQRRLEQMRAWRRARQRA